MKPPYQFDRFGNPVYRPTPDWQHRLVRWTSVITIALCVVILLWVR